MQIKFISWSIINISANFLNYYNLYPIIIDIFAFKFHTQNVITYGTEIE